MIIRHLLIPSAILVTEMKAAPILDIKTVAGKTPEEVKAVLGAPTDTAKTKQGPKLTYKDDTIEVVFIDGKADWITVTPATPPPFSKEFITLLGLQLTPPTFSNANSIRWEQLRGFVSISICPGEDPSKIDFAYIKVATK